MLHATIKNFSYQKCLNLTSSLLKAHFTLPNNDLEQILQSIAFSQSQKIMLKDLNLESSKNHFEIWINDELS